MQLLIDSVKYQREKGLNTNRVIVRKIKDDGEALREAAEQIRAIISECIERDLPIDDALAALHVATLKGESLNKDHYSRIIDAARAEPTSKIRQARSAQNVSLLKKIEMQSKK